MRNVGRRLPPFYQHHQPWGSLLSLILHLQIGVKLAYGTKQIEERGGPLPCLGPSLGLGGSQS